MIAGRAEPKGIFLFRWGWGMWVAVLIDGGFFVKRYPIIWGRATSLNAALVARRMYTMAHAHVQAEQLYRIFFYDSRPLSKKAHNPVTGRAVDFSRSEQAEFRSRLHDELKCRRKVALRLGELRDGGKWLIRPDATHALLLRQRRVEDLVESDVYYDISQKGVDIRIGVDIASLAYKKQVQRIVLVSGDSDFVPAAKLARREGIDFVLDPMWKPIRPELFEHIDGLQSKCPRAK